ncbi:hypothetical protein LOK49_LG12G01309 [Camellia lanceoleosa]|uniref:Uncharacterized protein n=1 Tax=Camellia lanceoleosa TaxID=1840588 RepID=A0ACC0FSJ2_9ERIC|nr:hypothetical protein LOK49_LG12G01309 [Camellia lanceoleosa]
MQGMQPVPSSIVNLRNLLGLSSRVVTTPRVSAREKKRGEGLREKEVGSEDDGVRERKSKARSFTYWRESLDWGSLPYNGLS